jgi:hypothetical protein
MDACAPQGAPNQLVTNINKEVIFHKMVFESLNLGPGAPNSACGSTAKKVTVNRLRFAIASPSREYDPENMLFGAISPLRASKF